MSSLKRLFLLIAVLTMGCAGAAPSPVDTAGGGNKTILVLPVKNQTLLHGDAITYRCGLCGGVFSTGKIEEGAEQFIAQEISTLFSRQAHLALIPEEKIPVDRLEELLDVESKAVALPLLVKLGKEFSADLVLSAGVFRFSQRVGSDFAADTPASVGIDLDVIDTATGEIVWHAKIDVTQSCLTENLFMLGTFIKRGGKWLTAEDLASFELQDVLERSPIP